MLSTSSDVPVSKEPDRRPRYFGSSDPHVNVPCGFPGMQDSNECSGSLSTTLPSTDSRERVILMEDIIRHVFGNMPSDTENLQKIMDSLQEADRGSPKSTDTGDMDDSEELSIADQEFTVKALSNNTTRWPILPPN